MIDLFWRNINTDQLFDDMYANGKMTVTISGSPVAFRFRNSRLRVPFEIKGVPKLTTGKGK
jgi:hypothetical protein